MLTVFQSGEASFDLPMGLWISSGLLAKAFHVNLGNDRPNVQYNVVEMENAQDFDALMRVLNIAPNARLEDILKTLIFANTRKLTQRIWRYLRDGLGERFHDGIDFLHAGRRFRGRKHVMKRFEDGEVRILIATEVAEMVRILYVATSMRILNGIVRVRTYLTLRESFSLALRHL